MAIANVFSAMLKYLVDSKGIFRRFYLNKVLTTTMIAISELPLSLYC